MRVVVGTLSLLALGANADLTVQPPACGNTSGYAGAQGYFTGGHRGCRYRWVSPKLTILDDCNFELSDFDFDFIGTSVDDPHEAPDAKLWVHRAANLDNVLADDEDGEAASEKITKNYAGRTVYGSLPPGAEWKDFTTLSVYCELRDVTFGYFNFVKYPAFVEPTPEEMHEYETVCCDDGGTCEEWWNGTEPYETDDDEETCGGPPGKPCKECARKYCEDARGKTARLECLVDNFEKHHLYEDMCLEELGLTGGEEEEEEEESAEDEMCGGTPTKPCKDCAEQYCDDVRGKTARLECLLDNTDNYHLYEDMCREELGLPTDSDGMCGGTPTKPCKDCADRYCDHARGKTDRLECLVDHDQFYHLYEYMCLEELGLATEEEDEEEEEEEDSP